MLCVPSRRLHTYPSITASLTPPTQRTRITISPGQGLPSTSGRGSFRRGQPREVKSPDSPWQYEPAEESLLARGYGESTVRSLQAWAETFNATKPKDVKNDLVLVERVLEHICSREPPGAVLVFLTGWDEISNLHKALQANRAFSPTQARPCHDLR